MGSLAFRKSMTASLFSFGNNGASPMDRVQDESIGSAGSLAHRSQDEEEDEEDEQDSQDFGPEFMPVAIFLAGLGMKVLLLADSLTVETIVSNLVLLFFCLISQNHKPVLGRCCINI